MVAADAAQNEVTVTSWITSAIGLALQGQVLAAEEGVTVVSADELEALPSVSPPKAVIKTPKEAESAVQTAIEAHPEAEREYRGPITKEMQARGNMGRSKVR